MRSALLAVAAFAATVIAHQELTHNVPRDLPSTRLARRSPAEKAALDLKNEQNIKCVVQTCAPPTVLAGGGFAEFFTSVSSVTTFTSAHLIFPPPPPFFQGITNLGWGGFSGFFGNNVNGLFTFVTALQGQQNIALQSAVLSFQNIVQVLLLITQGFGHGSQWGPIANFLDPISAVYTQLWQFIQGLMAWIFTTFTLDTFGGAVGGNWQLFQQTLTQLLSIGQQFQILQTNCLMRGGINLDFFLTQCGFTAFQPFQSLFSYSTSTFISSSFGPWAPCITPDRFPDIFPPYPFPPHGFSPNFIPDVYPPPPHQPNILPPFPHPLPPHSLPPHPLPPHPLPPHPLPPHPLPPNPNDPNHPGHLPPFPDIIPPSRHHDHFPPPPDHDNPQGDGEGVQTISGRYNGNANEFDGLQTIAGKGNGNGNRIDGSPGGGNGNGNSFDRVLTASGIGNGNGNIIDGVQTLAGKGNANVRPS